jgi:hypothetical protein
MTKQLPPCRGRDSESGAEMRKEINRGSIGCAAGIAIMSVSVFLAGVIFVKCFGIAYNHDFTMKEYISALFTRHALTWYLATGALFSFGLWLAIDALITIFKDFFEV